MKKVLLACAIAVSAFAGCSKEPAPATPASAPADAAAPAAPEAPAH